MLVSSYILKHTIRVVHLAATYTITTHFCHPNKGLLIFLCILHCAILNFVSQVTNKGLVASCALLTMQTFSRLRFRVFYTGMIITVLPRLSKDFSLMIMNTFLINKLPFNSFIRRQCTKQWQHLKYGQCCLVFTVSLLSIHGDINDKFMSFTFCACATAIKSV